MFTTTTTTTTMVALHRQSNNNNNKSTTTMMIRSILILLSTALLFDNHHVMAQHGSDTVGAANNSQLCLTTALNNNTFTVVVNLFASETGYFSFEECGLDNTNPTLGLIVGETYTFVQKDISNWMHPLGFAYYPDGAHDDKEELETTIVPPGSTNSNCTDTYTCPAPKYHLNDEFLGVANTSDFGLDSYEPLFSHNPVEWTTYGTFSVQVTFDDANFNQDFFYFCHIHQYMSGRIKLLNSDLTLVNPDGDVPEIEYNYDVPGSFDQTCGTYGLDAYQLPNKECPSHFVCSSDDDESDTGDDLVTATSRTSSSSNMSSLSSFRGGTEANELYATCIDAMNCHMLQKITTGVQATSSSAPNNDGHVGLFIHQMIPHHRNAVNMAKTLLHVKGTSTHSDSSTSPTVLNCTDITNEDDPQCIMEVILREIINSQNHEIQIMYSILESLNLPKEEECTIEVTTGGSTNVTTPTTGTDVSPPTATPPTSSSSTTTTYGNRFSFYINTFYVVVVVVVGTMTWVL